MYPTDTHLWDASTSMHMFRSQSPPPPPHSKWEWKGSARLALKQTKIYFSYKQNSEQNNFIFSRQVLL